MNSCVVSALQLGVQPMSVNVPLHSATSSLENLRKLSLLYQAIQTDLTGEI